MYEILRYNFNDDSIHVVIIPITIDSELTPLLWIWSILIRNKLYELMF